MNVSRSRDGAVQAEDAMSPPPESNAATSQEKEGGTTSQSLPNNRDSDSDSEVAMSVLHRSPGAVAEDGDVAGADSPAQKPRKRIRAVKDSDEEQSSRSEEEETPDRTSKQSKEDCGVESNERPAQQSWNAFQAAHAHKGLTKEQMKEDYKSAKASAAAPTSSTALATTLVPHAAAARPKPPVATPAAAASRLLASNLEANEFSIGDRIDAQAKTPEGQSEWFPGKVIGKEGWGRNASYTCFFEVRGCIAKEITCRRARFPSPPPHPSLHFRHAADLVCSACAMLFVRLHSAS